MAGTISTTDCACALKNWKLYVRQAEVCHESVSMLKYFFLLKCVIVLYWTTCIVKTLIHNL